MAGVARSAASAATPSSTASRASQASRQLASSSGVTPELLASWREACDARLAVELGVAALAAERATPAMLGALVSAMDDRMDDFPAYRQADVRFHIGLAEATGSQRLVAAMTEVQAGMS